jgi:hypothetical protein
MSALHRENPEASEEQIERLAAFALLTASAPATGPQIERSCRDCGNPFHVPLDRAHVNSKWYALCSYCLMNEL